MVRPRPNGVTCETSYLAMTCAHYRNRRQDHRSGIRCRWQARRRNSGFMAGVKRVSNEGSGTRKNGRFYCREMPSVKKVRTPCLNGSTQEKSPSEIFRFGYGKASSDKKVPDPVGSALSSQIGLFASFVSERLLQFSSKVADPEVILCVSCAVHSAPNCEQ